MLHWYTRTNTGYFYQYTRQIIVHLSQKKVICMMKLLLWHEVFLEYIHQTQNHNRLNLKWQFVFQNASEKGLVSLKLIINILTVFITQTYGFIPVRGDPSYNNLITFRYVLLSTSFNEWIYVITDIAYHTDNPSLVRRILKRVFFFRLYSDIR